MTEPAEVPSGKGAEDLAVVDADGVRRIDDHLAVEEVGDRRNQLSVLVQPDREQSSGDEPHRCCRRIKGGPMASIDRSADRA
jgi:hypothetical protein